MIQGTRNVLSVALCLFTLVAVNYSVVEQPQSALAIFVGLGLCLCYLSHPAHPKLGDKLQWLDITLAGASLVCCGFIVVQLEPAFSKLWLDGKNLHQRIGDEVSTIDFAIGVVGVLLVVEAARRSIGWIVPILATVFVAHSLYCRGSFELGWPQFPDWMLPHRGQGPAELTSTLFLKASSIFGPATSVMFTYVFLFTVFGGLLEVTGATDFIIRLTQRMFGRSVGGPAKVAVLGSGLMGSLSGSAVANAMTSGTFTIPMMRSSGFRPHIAGAIEAAASSGGALVPPIMGAGAYMMLQFCTRPDAGGKPLPVSFQEIAIAAIIPAVLYYLSLLLIVHFYSRRIQTKASDDQPMEVPTVPVFEGAVFCCALATLTAMLVMFTPNKAVTAALAVILVMAAFRRKLPISRMARVLAIFVFLAGAAAFAIFLASWQFTTVSLRQDVQEAINALVVGMLGLIAFGLIHPQWRPSILGAFVKAAKQAIPLIAASACVGIIIGVINQSGIIADFSQVIDSLVDSKLLTLFGIMVCSLILGMGVPSVVCYILLATLMAPILIDMNIDPLAAHMFIFYFGLMSMVTPPVALAAYATATIAGSNIMQTAFAAFRFALVGFTLPFMFVYRPELLLINTPESPLVWYQVLWGVAIALAGVFALAVGLAGYLRGPLILPIRLGMFAAAGLLLTPDISVGGQDFGLVTNIAAMAGVLAFCVFNWIRVGRQNKGASP